LTVNVGGLAGGVEAAAAAAAAFFAFFPFFLPFLPAGAAAALTGTKSELKLPSGEQPVVASPDVTVWF
jgi:hypothetical protein